MVDRMQVDPVRHRTPTTCGVIDISKLLTQAIAIGQFGKTSLALTALFLGNDRRSTRGIEFSTKHANGSIATASRTMLTAVEYELEVQRVPSFDGKPFLEIDLCLDDRSTAGQSPALRQSMDVGVDGEGGHPKALTHDDGSRFVSDPRQSLESFKRIWDDPGVVFDNKSGEFTNRLRLLRAEPTRLNDSLNRLHRLRAHGLWGICQLPKIGGDSIDHFVGALRAENHRHEQCKGISMVQRNGSGRIELGQSLLNVSSSFRFFHCQPARRRLW